MGLCIKSFGEDGGNLYREKDRKKEFMGKGLRTRFERPKQKEKFPILR